MPERKENAVKKFLNNLIIAILLLVIALLAFVMFQNRVHKTTPCLGGYQLYIVLSGSMQPALDVGSVVIVKAIDPEEVKTGDIITFRGEKRSDALTTHRVIGINTKTGLSFQTKGDANEVADPTAINPTKLVGKVVLHMPYAGYVLDYTKRNPQLPALIAFPAVMLILWEGLKFGQKLRKRSLNKTKINR
jgi:signal peptidase